MDQVLDVVRVFSNLFQLGDFKTGETTVKHAKILNFTPAIANHSCLGTDHGEKPAKDVVV